MNTCKSCHNQFKTIVRIDGKRRDLRHRAYCITCSPFIPFSEIQSKHRAREHKCFISSCTNLTFNPKFCSSSCSAKYSNCISPKKQKQRMCPSCKGTKIFNDRTYCVSCWELKKNELGLSLDYSSIKLCESSKRRVYGHARAVYKNSGKPRLCCNCGYNKHYEVCHIKGVETFGPESLLSEVNDISNLIALCPNCHCELDHGGLMLRN